MGSWFWLNVPLALLFVCCWAGIPLWLTCTRWHAEIEAKHAEIAVAAGPVPVVAPRLPAVSAARETASPALAGAAEQPGR
ncbi:MAG: hypothetical protein ACLQDY_16745 [Streptosporangiaceae bacterium]